MLLCEDYAVQYLSHGNIYIKFSLMLNIDLFMSKLIGLEAKKANIYLVGTFQKLRVTFQSQVPSSKINKLIFFV